MSVSVRVDEAVVEVPDGASVLDAARVAGVTIPSLCWDPRLAPYGACRVCLVGVEGSRSPLAACTTRVSNGMVVHTDDPVARDTARASLELIVSEISASARSTFRRTAASSSRVCQMLGVDGTRSGGERRHGGADHSHPYVKLDRDLCIGCARCVRMCDEVQGTFALEMVGRGFGTVVATDRGGLDRLFLRLVRCLCRFLPERCAL